MADGIAFAGRQTHFNHFPCHYIVAGTLSLQPGHEGVQRFDIRWTCASPFGGAPTVECRGTILGLHSHAIIDGVYHMLDADGQLAQQLGTFVGADLGPRAGAPADVVRNTWRMTNPETGDTFTYELNLNTFENGAAG